MATQLKEDFTEAARWRRRPRPSFAWLAQAVSGVLLLVLLTVHMVAQHFVVEGGLRTYADVVTWIRNPVVFAVEALLLVCVTLACAVGPSGSWPGCCSIWPWSPSSTACGCCRCSPSAAEILLPGWEERHETQPLE